MNGPYTNHTLLFFFLAFFSTFLLAISYFSPPLSFYAKDYKILEPTALTHAHIQLNTKTARAKHCSEKEDSGDCIHVVLSANGPYLLPLQACINSIIQNTVKPLYIHLIVAEGESGEFVRGLQQAGILKGTPLEIVEFNVKRVVPLIRVWEGENLDAYENPFNYARYYLPLLFKDLKTMIYLDPDTVVTVDIGLLWDLFRANKAKHKKDGKSYMLAAAIAKPDVKTGSICNMLNCKDEELDKVILDKTSPYFNAGVFITDLSLWRSVGITDMLEHWLRSNTVRRLWKWGSQGALGIVFYGKWFELDASWNQRNSRKWISFVNSKDDKGLEAALATGKVYHFTTSMKPWTSKGNTVIWDLWCKYYPKKHLLWFCRQENRTPAPLSALDFGFLRALFL